MLFVSQFFNEIIKANPDPNYTNTNLFSAIENKNKQALYQLCGKLNFQWIKKGCQFRRELMHIAELWEMEPSPAPPPIFYFGYTVCMCLIMIMELKCWYSTHVLQICEIIISLLYFCGDGDGDGDGDGGGGGILIFG